MNVHGSWNTATSEPSNHCCVVVYSGFIACIFFSPCVSGSTLFSGIASQDLTDACLENRVNVDADVCKRIAKSVASWRSKRSFAWPNGVLGAAAFHNSPVGGTSMVQLYCADQKQSKEKRGEKESTRLPHLLIFYFYYFCY